MDLKQTVEIRRATEADYAQIVDLQLRNLNSNLTAEQKADGFLSGYFDAHALSEVNRDLAVLVCAESSKPVGFICLTTPAFQYQPEVAAAMISAVRTKEILGKPFDAWKACIGGPVCIEREYRGQGIFAGMYEQLPHFSADCTLLLTLIATNNARSIAAHAKVGLSSVSDFACNGRAFVILAKTI